MNNLSTYQIELVTEDKVSVGDFSQTKPLTKERYDEIVREAYVAQAEVVARIIKAAFKFIGMIIVGIQSGLRATRTYDKLTRMSDRDLADIGIRRDQIGNVVLREFRSD